MTRFRASAIHLAISASLAALVLLVMLGVWYPGSYFKLMGGGLLLVLIVGVDVCLGPLATLVVFKSGKPGLKFDLSVIAILQLSALIYGVSVMFVARPAFTVFVVDKFRVAAANEIEDVEFAKALQPQWKKPPLTGPELAAAVMPTDKKEHNDVVFAGVDMHQLPRLYVPYSEKRDMVLKKAQPLAVLAALSPQNKEAVASLLRQRARPEGDFVFLPLRARDDFMVAIIDAKTGDFLEILDANPYKD